MNVWSLLSAKTMSLISLLVAIAFLLRANGRELSEEDLTHTTKHVIQSIVEHGDIFDCFDIYKQPALNHPLLKNHKLQIRPSSFPTEDTDLGASDDTPAEIGLKNGCPEGSVPILRPHISDKIDTHLNISSRAYPTDGPKPWYPEYPNVHVGLYSTIFGQFYGSRGVFNVWNPHTQDIQYSDLKMTVVGTHDAIQAGWRVDRSLFQDDLTRLFGRWTVDSWNPKGWQINGFVHVTTNISLGSAIWPVSSHNGPQYIIDLRINKDSATGNWWLMWSNKAQVVGIGYWPNELFKSLKNFAGHVVWGAETYKGPSNLPWPEMGSGYGPGKGGTGRGIVAYIEDLSIMNFHNEILSVLNHTDVNDRANAKCVGVARAFDGSYKGFTMYAGGSGGFC